MPAHSFQLTSNPLPPPPSPAPSSPSRGVDITSHARRLTEIEKFYSQTRTQHHLSVAKHYCQLVQISAYHECPKCPSPILSPSPIPSSRHRNVSQLVSVPLDPSPCPDVCVALPAAICYPSVGVFYSPLDNNRLSSFLTHGWGWGGQYSKSAKCTARMIDK